MNNMILTTDQQNALDAFIDFLNDSDKKYLIIQGAAGCGKSTLIPYLMKALHAQYNMYKLLLKTNKYKTEFKKIDIAATTNQAVTVLKELTGYKAYTIHSLLGLKIVNNFKTGKTELQLKRGYHPLYNRLLIIDEASMIDDQLFEKIEETVIDSKIVLMGDEWQLAPIGQTLSTMATLKYTKVVMNKILRNSGSIMKTGAQFRQTVETKKFLPIKDDPKIKFINGTECQKLIDTHFNCPNYITNKIKILAWTNKKVQMYNAHIRKIKGYNNLLQIGEWAITNNAIMDVKCPCKTDSFVEITDTGIEYTVHGVLGRNIQINKYITGFMANNPEHVKKLLKKLANRKAWPEYFTIKETWLDLRPSYASTVHKAQGRTYNVVFIDLSDIGKCRVASDVARMLYVAISRAKNQVYLYGSLPRRYGGI